MGIVSYLRYTPDVAPLPAEQFVPPRSRAPRWILGTVLYLALVAAWTWWMTLPPKLQPPLAIIPLPDGTELRLVHVAQGARLEFDTDETFGRRIYAPDNDQTWRVTLNAAPHSTWLIFTQYDPARRRLSNPKLPGVWIREGKSRFPHRVFGHANAGGGVLWRAYLTDIAPAREAIWDLQINYRGSVVHAKIANPFPVAPAHEFAAKPLPQTVTTREGTMELTGIVAGKRLAWNESGLPKVVPQLEIAAGALRGVDFKIDADLFDATGQRTNGGILPFDEPAWGMKVTARQWQAPEGSGQFLVGETAVPGPGEVFVLPVPPGFPRVTDVFFVGAGYFAIKGGKLREKGTGPEFEIASQASATFGVNEATLVILENDRVTASGTRPPADSMILRNSKLIFQLRDGKKITTSDHLTVDKHLSYVLKFPFGKWSKAGVPPGTKFRLEYFKPKELQGTFYVPPPDAMKFR